MLDIKPHTHPKILASHFVGCMDTQFQYSLYYYVVHLLFIITASLPVLQILNTYEEKLWNSKLAGFLCATFSPLSNKVQTGHLQFCACTLLPWLSCQEPSLGLIQEVSMFLMQPQYAVGLILQGMRGQVVSDMFSRYFNKFEVLQTQEHRVCKLITDMSSAVGENKNLL